MTPFPQIFEFSPLESDLAVFFLQKMCIFSIKNNRKNQPRPHKTNISMTSIPKKTEIFQILSLSW